MILLVLIYAAMLDGVRPTQADPALPTEAQRRATNQPAVVRIRAATPEESRRLIALGIELLEARDGDDLFAWVTPAEQDALLADGWDVRIDPEHTLMLRGTQLQTIRTGYRTVEETEQFLRNMAARYPHLATLVDFGDSWERQQSGGLRGYDLLALRLTNGAVPGPKPVFFLIAAIHAREMTTAELATRFIDHLLTQYGRDPNVTWILNEHEIVVVPIANPDGRKVAEQGYFQRKNMNNRNDANCTFPPSPIDQFGVDLNRNFAFAWGTVHGPEINPCSQVYPGIEAASEPETQALQAFIRSLYPYHTRLVDNDRPAPATTSGVVISLHSYSNLVLWPWGHSSKLAPNAAALEQLGRRLAHFSGYLPMQSVYLYPTSGTTDDWSYAELGIASYTFEIGPTSGICGGFMPPYACLDQGQDGSFWTNNLPALLYAARVARLPYLQPAGPDVRDITIVGDTDVFTLTITLDGRNHPVAAARMYVDESPWRGGQPIDLQPLDGAFDSEIEQGQIVLSRNTNAFLFLIHGSNADGDWGPLYATWTQPQYQHWFPLVAHSR